MSYLHAMDQVFPQFCSTVIAIEPTHFTYNKEAGEDNMFMNNDGKSDEQVQQEVSLLQGSQQLEKIYTNTH